MNRRASSPISGWRRGVGDRLFVSSRSSASSTSSRTVFVRRHTPPERRQQREHARPQHDGCSVMSLRLLGTYAQVDNRREDVRPRRPVCFREPVARVVAPRQTRDAVCAHRLSEAPAPALLPRAVPSPARARPRRRGTRSARQRRDRPPRPPAPARAHTGSRSRARRRMHPRGRRALHRPRGAPATLAAAPGVACLPFARRVPGC